MDILRSEKRKARKDYCCMFCGGIISKGEEYDRQTIVNDGEIYDFICHSNCLDIVSLLNMRDYGDGISLDDFETYIDYYVEEKHCGDEEWRGLTYQEKVEKIIKEIKED